MMSQGKRSQNVQRMTGIETGKVDGKENGKKLDSGVIFHELSDASARHSTNRKNKFEIFVAMQLTVSISFY